MKILAIMRKIDAEEIIDYDSCFISVLLFNHWMPKQERRKTLIKH